MWAGTGPSGSTVPASGLGSNSARGDEHRQVGEHGDPDGPAERIGEITGGVTVKIQGAESALTVAEREPEDRNRPPSVACA
jgi:hypothetical protein